MCVCFICVCFVFCVYVSAYVHRPSSFIPGFASDVFMRMAMVAVLGTECTLRQVRLRLPKGRLDLRLNASQNLIVLQSAYVFSF